MHICKAIGNFSSPSPPHSACSSCSTVPLEAPSLSPQLRMERSLYLNLPPWCQEPVESIRFASCRAELPISLTLTFSPARQALAAHTQNPGTREAEVGGLGLQGHPWLHSQFGAT